MRSSRSPPERGCSSPIRIRRGRDRQTRTRTGYCASTSRRAPTCPGGRPRTLKPSPSRSTTGPARSSAGRLPPKSSTSSYAHFNHPVLHRPVELANYTSQQFAGTLRKYNLRHSVGRTGICYDNAMAESFFGALKNERIHRTQYPTREHARRDIVRYIEFWYNSKRRHSGLQYRTPQQVHEEYLERQSAA